MTPIDTLKAHNGVDIHTLVKLFIFANALRDHLEGVFQHSERLSKEVTDLLEHALQGQRSPVGPTLALAGRQADLQIRASDLLQRAHECAESLAIQYGTLSDPKPAAARRDQIEGLLGLVDGLSMLQPFQDTHGNTVKKQFRALQATVEQVIHAALRSEDLSVTLGFVEAERVRFLENGPDAQAGCECLREAMEALTRAPSES